MADKMWVFPVAVMCRESREGPSIAAWFGFYVIVLYRHLRLSPPMSIRPALHYQRALRDLIEPLPVQHRRSNSLASFIALISQRRQHSHHKLHASAVPLTPFLPF